MRTDNVTINGKLHLGITSPLVAQSRGGSADATAPQASRNTSNPRSSAWPIENDNRGDPTDQRRLKN
jgi:hypothetical protein